MKTYVVMFGQERVNEFDTLEEAEVYVRTANHANKTNSYRIEVEEGYYINFHTGAGNFNVHGTLAYAQTRADQSAAYTQEKITIEDDSGNVIAERAWIPLPFEQEESEFSEDEVIRFGDFGFYDGWYVYD